MVRSMTGFGRYQDTVDGFDISVEIKSVNHRYLDFNIRIPRIYSFLEEKIKKHLQDAISRGKIDVYISIYKIDDDTKSVKINSVLAGEYLREMRKTANELGIDDDVKISTLTRFADIFESRFKEIDEETVWNALVKVLDNAVDGYTKMREIEGERLKNDMLGKNKLIAELLEKVEELAPLAVKEYRQRIEDRIRELIADVAIDENRLLTETAIFADKLAIDEEITRLKSHILQFESIMTDGERVGRKLDFLLQEMNRETNTIGSKCNNLEISKNVVEIKAELEKIREQLQNIE